jgi:hypothetical protein
LPSSSGGASPTRDQPLARGHDLAHRRVHARLEAQVAVGDDAHHGAPLQHRESPRCRAARQLHDLAHRDFGRDGDRVAQHAGFVALDARHLGRLLLRRQVLVHDADAAFLRDGDRQRASVTVSIAADTSGRFSVMLRDRRVARLVSRGSTWETQAPATRRRR